MVVGRCIGTSGVGMNDGGSLCCCIGGVHGSRDVSGGCWYCIVSHSGSISFIVRSEMYSDSLLSGLTNFHEAPVLVVGFWKKKSKVVVGDLSLNC